MKKNTGWRTIAGIVSIFISFLGFWAGILLIHQNNSNGAVVGFWVGVMFLLLGLCFLQILGDF